MNSGEASWEFLLDFVIGAVIVVIHIDGIRTGESLEWAKHRAFCLCEKCKAWRQKNREAGKEPE